MFEFKYCVIKTIRKYNCNTTMFATAFIYTIVTTRTISHSPNLNHKVWSYFISLI